MTITPTISSEYYVLPEAKIEQNVAARRDVMENGVTENGAKDERQKRAMQKVTTMTSLQAKTGRTTQQGATLSKRGTSEAVL
uniref:Uncharacterized protein n=1 Tax=Ascaris lumbricoides TaxID=6252 RepID=A0A0M3IDB1_ASCLU